MLATLLLALAPQFGSVDPIRVSARLEPAAAAPGAAVELRVRFEIEPGWHLYHPDIAPDLGIPVSVSAPKGFAVAGASRTGLPALRHAEDIGGEVSEYLWLAPDDEVILPLRMGDGPAGAAEGAASVTLQACDDNSCLPPEERTVRFAYTRLAAVAGTAAAPQEPLLDDPGRAVIRAEFVPPRARAGEAVELRLHLDLPPGYHAYHPDQDPLLGAPVRAGVPDGFEASGALRGASPAELHVERIGDRDESYRYLAADGDLVLPLRVAGGAAGAFATSVWVSYMICDEQSCDPEARQVLEVAFERLPGGSSGPLDRSLWFFLLMAAVAGAVSLATPCVFPMIPITVSFFTKRAESGKGSALGNASFYGLGIVLTFVGLGLGITAVYGATGVNSFASHPLVNGLLALLFVYFAFALLGFYEIEPPSWLQARLSRVTSQGQQKAGYLPVVLMAVAFSVTAFTCTVAFVGMVLLMAAQGAWFYAAAGMSVYAVVFAAPFFLLALFPTALRKMPKAGGWMNAVKVSMGFVELIFALKFLSNVDMVLEWQIFTRPVIVVLTALPLLLWAVYLFGFLPTPHEAAGARPGKRRLVLAVAALAGAGYVGQGLRGGPFWGPLEAFFPPSYYGDSVHAGVDMAWFEAAAGEAVQIIDEAPSVAAARTELARRFDLDQVQVAVLFDPSPGPAGLSWFEFFPVARKVAQEQGKPLFVDFTGVTCVNCRRMEGNVIPAGDNPALLEQFVRAELWVDKAPFGSWNKRFQVEQFDAAQQPLYLTLDPASLEETGRVDGYIPEIERFAAFLRAGLERHAQGARE